MTPATTGPAYEPPARGFRTFVVLWASHTWTYEAVHMRALALARTGLPLLAGREDSEQGPMAGRAIALDAGNYREDRAPIIRQNRVGTIRKGLNQSPGETDMLDAANRVGFIGASV